MAESHHELGVACNFEIAEHSVVINATFWIYILVN